MGSLLHIVIGSFIRAVVPKPWQDQAGKLLFWSVPLVLALMLAFLIITTDYS